MLESLTRSWNIRPPIMPYRWSSPRLKFESKRQWTHIENSWWTCLRVSRTDCISITAGVMWFGGRELIDGSYKTDRGFNIQAIYTYTGCSKSPFWDSISILLYYQNKSVVFFKLSKPSWITVMTSKLQSVRKVHFDVVSINLRTVCSIFHFSTQK